MIGQQIQSVRKDKKISLRSLAEISGLSYQFIWDVETGRRNPSIESLKKIAYALNLDLEIFLAPKYANSGNDSIQSDDELSETLTKKQSTGTNG